MVLSVESEWVEFSYSYKKNVYFRFWPLVMTLYTMCTVYIMVYYACSCK